MLLGKNKWSLEIKWNSKISSRLAEEPIRTAIVLNLKIKIKHEWTLGVIR